MSGAVPAGRSWVKAGQPGHHAHALSPGERRATPGWARGVAVPKHTHSGVKL